MSCRKFRPRPPGSSTASATGLSVGLPSQTFTNTDKLTQAAGQAPAEEQTKTRTEQSGTAPEQKIDAITGRQASALPITEAALKPDPVLQYQTAAALFQEVALLNHYVDSAALRHNFLPYLVRLQIAVTPTVAREPYDVLSRISFFARPRRKFRLMRARGRPPAATRQGTRLRHPQAVQASRSSPPTTWRWPGKHVSPTWCGSSV